MAITNRRIVSTRRLARLEAIIVLTMAGWSPEKIAMVLTMSRSTIEREIVKFHRISFR